jgi:hypothetical protein
VAGAVVLALAAPACSSHGGVSTADAQKWATVRAVNDLYGHLLAFLVVGESSIRTLSQQRDLQSHQGRSALSGAQTSWQNVLAQLTNFTLAQAKVVPTLGSTIGTLKAATTQWQDALFKAQQEAHSGKATTFSDIAPLFKQAQIEEGQVRAKLRTTAAAIANEVCALETRNPGLSPTGSASADCATASRLSP